MAQTNTEMFNDKSGVHKHGGHGKWMIIHGILMLGMLLPMVAAAAPVGAATLGDGAVQALHMVKDMIAGLTSNFGVAADMASNAAGGDFAAHTLEATSMHNGPAAGLHAGIGAQFTQFDQWMGSLSPQQLLEIKEEASSIYNMSLGEYFQSNIMQHGLH